MRPAVPDLARKVRFSIVKQSPGSLDASAEPLLRRPIPVNSRRPLSKVFVVSADKNFLSLFFAPKSETKDRKNRKFRPALFAESGMQLLTAIYKCSISEQ